MLSGVFTKTLRDYWLRAIIGAVTLVLFLIFAMASYRAVDIAIYTDLPDVFLELYNIANVDDAGGLAYGTVYSFMGALTLAGIAISIGSGAIAGEERKGTMGLLLANPKSRTHVLVSKAASLFLLMNLAALILWGGAHLVPTLIDVNVVGKETGGLVLHMLVNALFYGFLALMIGAWTGNKTTASGVPALVMVVSYLAVGILPLVEGIKDLSRIFPWYYYTESNPIFHGIDWGHLGVLFSGVVVFLVLAVFGMNRRDLSARSAAVTLFDRLRNYPFMHSVIERLAGSARVSRIWVKTMSDHQGLLVVTGFILLFLCVIVGLLYPVLEDQMQDFSEDMPEAMDALIGQVDIGTPEGWYQAENFSMTGPFLSIFVAVVVSARSLAGEEADRTMGLLLANPISRIRVLSEKALAMLVYVFLLAVVVFVGTIAGSLLGDLGLNSVHVAATCFLLGLVSLVFGTVALALSAATGRSNFAMYVTAGLALASYLLQSFLPLNEDLAGYAKVSPFYYYLKSDPLTNGMNWAHAGVLAALIAVFYGVSVLLFQRRDLR